MIIENGELKIFGGRPRASTFGGGGWPKARRKGPGARCAPLRITTDLQKRDYLGPPPKPSGDSRGFGGESRSSAMSELSPQAEARDMELATTKGAASWTRRTFPLGGRWSAGPDEGATDRFVLGGPMWPPAPIKNQGRPAGGPGDTEYDVEFICRRGRSPRRPGRRPARPGPRPPWRAFPRPSCSGGCAPDSRPPGRTRPRRPCPR